MGLWNRLLVCAAKEAPRQEVGRRRRRRQAPQGAGGRDLRGGRPAGGGPQGEGGQEGNGKV